MVGEGVGAVDPVSFPTSQLQFGQTPSPPGAPVVWGLRSEGAGGVGMVHSFPPERLQQYQCVSPAWPGNTAGPPASRGALGDLHTGCTQPASVLRCLERTLETPPRRSLRAFRH